MIPANKQQNHARRHAGLIIALVISISAVALATGPLRESSAQADARSWSYTGSLNTARPGRSATLLRSGKVLVVGGDVGGCPAAGVLASAELYEPSTGTWSFTLLNGEEQKTRNDHQNPPTTLIGEKAGKKIRPGDTLQVQNPDGTLSEEFIFTGS